MRILVVDDEHEFGTLMGKLLERLGCEPVIAIDPQQALAILADEDQPVAGVITDIEMPGMTGVDLARAIREAVGADIPIAFCTGSDPSDSTTQRAATMGPVLSKRASLSEKREVIKEMISVWAPPPRP